MNDTLPDNHVRVFDFTKTNSDVHNLDALPANARRVWDRAVRIESRGFQELLGYNADRKIIWSCGGYWTGQRANDNSPDLFHITSMGDGTQLFVE
jgi:hypothetical protein